MSGSKVAYAAYQGARDQAIDEFMSAIASIENAFHKGEATEQEALIDTHYYAIRLRQDIERADTTYKAVTNAYTRS